MANERFTPGKWTNYAEDGHYTGAQQFVNNSDNTATIAIVYGETEPVRLANAALIAAAPAMYEALKMIAGWAGNLPDERLTSKTGPNDAALRGQMVVAMRSFAEAALAAANPETVKSGSNGK